jgi:hypothetical protein
LVGHAALA